MQTTLSEFNTLFIRHDGMHASGMLRCSIFSPASGRRLDYAFSAPLGRRAPRAGGCPKPRSIYFTGRNSSCELIVFLAYSESENKVPHCSNNRLETLHDCWL